MYRRPASTIIRYALGIILVFVLLVGDVRPASAALRCYVRANASGLNNGSSWTHAFTSLQSALGGSACTEVWVAKGTYKPTTSSSRLISFQLKNGVALYGGFAGTETELGQRSPAANPTILSGDIATTSTTDNSFHVVNGAGTNSTAVLDGFTITHGRAFEEFPGSVGAGILNNPGSPTLRNLFITDNQAYEYGAGMFNFESSPTLINVRFHDNFANSHAGGMLNIFSSPILTNVTFSDNAANGFYGGGMHNNSSSPILTNVTFTNNSSVGGGGGMANTDGSSPILKNVTFHANSSETWGGGMMNLEGSNPSLTNVSFIGNFAGTGAGIYNDNSSPALKNVTFTGNSSGVALYNVNGSHVTIKNSILFGDPGGEILNSGSTTTASYSIVQGGYPGTGNLSDNPLLLPLGKYGGYTKTMPLAIGSPAIDKGTNTGCPAKDQRGIARPADGNGDGVAVCDMGATESSVLTKSFSSSASQDGWVLESTELSGVGGSMNASQSTIAVGDDAGDRQGISILSFNTSSLPDSAVILSAKLKIRLQEVVGTNPFTTHGNLLVDVRKGAFGNNSALQLADFQAAANKSAVMSIPNTPLDNWYSKAMAPANMIYINKSGHTQFRLRFALEDDNDNTADYVKFFSGDATTASSRPKLVIQYYAP